MATETIHATVETDHEPAETLTDEQIEQLLQEAESRLRHNAELQITTTSNGSLEKRRPIPKLQHGLDRSAALKDQQGVATVDPKTSITAEQEKQAEGLRQIEKSSHSKRANDIKDAGPKWFNLPKTELTAQLKRDLQLIEMRSVLDPHRHYKKDTRKGKVPVFSQVGTIIEGPTEFFSGRINKKDRSKNFVEEAMKIEAENGRFKRKYAEIQETKTSGRKGHYKKLMAKRKKS